MKLVTTTENRVFERILLPIVNYSMSKQRGKSLGVPKAFGTRMSENTVSSRSYRRV